MAGQEAVLALVKAASWSSFIVLDEMPGLEVQWWMEEIGSLTK